jgi:isocitrate lyase
MKRIGIEGIYLGGWATSAKGSTSEDPGPDLASYPLSQVPDEAAVLVRALLAADRNQQYQLSRMSDTQRQAATVYDYRPWIIADADTGHGGDPHVRNLVRRFVEAGVPGYHIEDQRPGTKKCGHQGGKVLVASDEQIKRLNAARFQLDVMGVAGIIVARTDAEAATLLDGRGDERDQPFILGATNLQLPSYKACFLALLRRFHQLGVTELNGYLLYALSDEEYAAADAWLDRTGLAALAAEGVSGLASDARGIDAAFDSVESRLVERWEAEAGLQTYGDAVAEVLAFRASEGEALDMSADDWRAFARRASFYAAREKARALGVHIVWDCEHAKTPEGYYQVRGGVEYAIAKSLAAAPFADILWMETKTADLADAKQFADAIHAEFPEMMLAYNLSPSFNWDSTGMSDDEMRRFPEELGKMGFVFNFITYGGHQIDGVAAEEFATELRQDGMLALARLQRKIRLVESPYRTPQTLVGGPRADAALAASSGFTATTKAMGKGSTQHQHLMQTEVPKKLLEEWLAIWSAHYQRPEKLRVALRPQRAGSELLELAIQADGEEPLANVIFAPIQDRRGRSILSVRDQNTYAEALRQEAPDDARPPLADPPLQGGLGALRHADRGQPVPDRENAVARHLRGREHRGRPDHRRQRRPPAHRGAARGRPRGAHEADSQGAVMATVLVAADWAPIRAFEPLVRFHPEAVYGDLLPALRNADLRIVNCECALTRSTREVWKSGAVFKGEPAHAHGLTAVPFDVACLANNHVMDYGVAGLRETLRVLAARASARSARASRKRTRTRP